MRAVFGFFLVLIVSACASLAPASDTRYEVRSNCGTRAHCFTKIQGALDAAKAQAAPGWVEVHVAAGDYYEKVTIDRAQTRLFGKGRARTRLHFDAVAETARDYHRTRWGTPGSATLTINANEVSVTGITVENTFDYLSNDALPEGDARKIGNSQGVAVLLDVSSDRVFFDEVAMIGNQDTLFANGKRGLVRSSFISGNVDFIFGNGQLLIEDSTLETRRRAQPLKEGEFHSFITAPSTQLSEPVGIVVYGSRLTREDGVPDGSVALGRPWHPTTTFPDGRYADPNAVGQASFIDCFMDAHIHRQGWTSMNGTARNGEKTDVFKPQDSRFHESGSTGPGAAREAIGIKWQAPLTINDVRNKFMADW